MVQVLAQLSWDLSECNIWLTTSLALTRSNFSACLSRGGNAHRNLRAMSSWVFPACLCSEKPFFSRINIETWPSIQASGLTQYLPRVPPICMCLVEIFWGQKLASNMPQGGHPIVQDCWPGEEMQDHPHRAIGPGRLQWEIQWQVLFCVYDTLHDVMLECPRPEWISVQHSQW